MIAESNFRNTLRATRKYNVGSDNVPTELIMKAAGLVNGNSAFISNQAINYHIVIHKIDSKACMFVLTVYTH